MPKKHIILIHGFLENATMWKHLAGRLSIRSFRVHAPELAGHGHRPALQGRLTIKDYAADVLAQLDIEPDDRAIIVGHSMGGYVSLELCKLIPGNVKALCLFHSSARADSESKKTDRQRAIDAVKQNKPLYARTMITSLFHPDKTEKYKAAIDDQVEAVLKMETDAIVQAIEAMRDRPDNIAYLLDRSYPLYYFLGEKDSRLPIDEMKKELETLPGSVADIVVQTGHMGHIECPQEAADFIQRIIRADS